MRPAIGKRSAFRTLFGLLYGFACFMPSVVTALEQTVLSLQILETPDSRQGSVAWAVSDDGTVIVGEEGFNAAIWQDGQLTSLFTGEARGVSGNGSVVIGRDYSGTFPLFGVIWEENTEKAIEGLPETNTIKTYSVSRDGSVIVGNSNSAQSQAFRWEDGTMAGLGYLDDNEMESEAYDVSADGSVVVGMSRSGGQFRGFRWENGVMSDIGPGTAYGVSADGTTVVGSDYTTSHSFLWKGGERKELYGAMALKASGDGSVVVGLAYGDDDRNDDLPLIWSESNAYQVSLLNYLVDDSGIDRKGFSLVTAYDITPDGTIIVGKGYYPEIDAIKSYAYKLTLSEPIRSWANFTLENGYADTGTWLGVVWPETMEWVWSVSLQKWIYVPRPSSEAGSGWIYLPR